MGIVDSKAQLEENFAVLHTAILAGDERAKDLVRKGKSIVVGTFANELAFGPSRFLGYVGNDIDQHILMRPERDGKETNPAIDRVLGFNKSQNVNAEAEFIAYCQKLGLQPTNNKRNYWVLPDAQELIEIGVISDDTKLTNTEKLALIKSRIGQGKFRNSLDERWSNKCCITGCNVRAALRASHIKPWKVCTNIERLDSNNGLLLCANADALFDSGLISFDDKGVLIHSEALSKDNLKLLLGNTEISIQLNKSQQNYMQYHRKSHGFL